MPRSAEIDPCGGVSRIFQVSAYRTEPSEASFACNLLSKNDCRAALSDEPEHLRPEMSLVLDASSFTGCAERLTWAASGPDGAVVGPSCQSKSEGPSADAGEEVDLGVSFEVIGFHFLN